MLPLRLHSQSGITAGQQYIHRVHRSGQCAGIIPHPIIGQVHGHQLQPPILQNARVGVVGALIRRAYQQSIMRVIQQRRAAADTKVSVALLRCQPGKGSQQIKSAGHCRRNTQPLPLQQKVHAEKQQHTGNGNTSQRPGQIYNRCAQCAKLFHQPQHTAGGAGHHHRTGIHQIRQRRKEQHEQCSDHGHLCQRNQHQITKQR